MLAPLLFLLVPVAVQLLVTLGTLLTYVGFLFQWLGPIVGFFFFFIGEHGGEKAKRQGSGQRPPWLAYTS